MNSPDDDLTRDLDPASSGPGGETLGPQRAEALGRETVPDSSVPGVGETQSPTLAAPPAEAAVGADGIGSVIGGKYTLIEIIGEGGMGSVYLARQSTPVKRNVALKLIKRGMDSKTVLARFEAERQALALMDHPNIARVFDGGVTPSGQPYFVMEAIPGVSITRYCDDHRLSPNARLALFVQVCKAVQHAHQKGIIHRDLKPGNVLVTEVDGHPTPKVIDFGVAKATEQRLTDQSFGDAGAIVGTPTYMSPEQADPTSMDIDTRTDVYALGVMLYELLAGSPPIDARQFQRGAILEMLRMVREVEPPRPSARLSTAEAMPSIAACRNVDAIHLMKWLRGDIDWIVMKALEKARERRYETANGFAADIERFLANEPVVARPPSRAYRTRKFVRRNRGAVAAASLVLLALVVGVIGTSLGIVEARAQRDAAEKARGQAVAAAAAEQRARLAESEQRQAAELANQQAFDALKSFTDDLMGKVLGGRDALTDNEKSILRNAQSQWEVFAKSKGESPEARVIRSEGAAELSLLQSKLGMNIEAEENDRLALRLRASLADEFPDAPRYRLKQGMSHQNLGAILRANGNRAEAEVNFQQAVAVFSQLAQAHPDEQQYRRRMADGLISLANTERSRQDLTGAERHYREALAIQEQLAAENPRSPGYRDDQARSHWGLGFTLKRAGRLEDSETEYRKALELKEALAEELPADVTHQNDVANLCRELGVFLSDNENDEAAAKLFPKAIAILARLAGEFPSMPAYRHDLARCRRDYGRVLGFLERSAEAGAEFRESIALEENLVDENPLVFTYQNELGLSYAYLANMMSDGGDPAGGMEWHDKAIRVLTANHERDRQASLAKSALSNAHASRARALNRLKRHVEAVPDWDRAIELATPGRSPEFRAMRAVTRARAGQFDAALSELAEVTKSDPTDPNHFYNFACVYVLAGSLDAARKEEYAARAVEQLQEAVKAGFKNAKQLAEDGGLDPLRTRPDFQALLAELARKFPPRGEPAQDPEDKQ